MSSPSDSLTNDLVAAIADEAGKELEQSHGVIRHCVEQLTDEQFWWRPSESMNSIANLMLHLCGNVRQWIVSGVGGTTDDRQRQKEFDARGSESASELLTRVAEVVAEARAVMKGVTDDELLRVRRVQGYDVTGLQAIVHSISHFRGHTQEIVHMTRCQLGDSYQFDFVPSAAQK